MAPKKRQPIPPPVTKVADASSVSQKKVISLTAETEEHVKALLKVRQQLADRCSRCMVPHGWPPCCHNTCPSTRGTQNHHCPCVSVSPQSQPRDP